MGQEILTSDQKKVLDYLSEQDFIRDFYLTDGTALAAFYLNHRYSEDLDFFTAEEEIDVKSLTVFFESLKPKLNITAVDFQKSLNRNLFFLKTPNGIIKTEFTFFPFEPIETGLNYHKLKIDSLLDIAVNKLFTIYQQPRARDFIDLFFIIQEKNYDFDDLLAKIKLKFDWPIDALNLGSQLIRIRDLKDYPRMIKAVNESKLIDFFEATAKKLNPAVLE